MSRPGGLPDPPDATSLPPGTCDPPISLIDDCAQCAGLCCVMLAFTRSSDFALDKAAGEPCPHLDRQFRCSIHSQLSPAGFRGCHSYTCFGAGPPVTRGFQGRTWRSDPSTGRAMAACFAVARALHELLWYVRAALAEPVGDLRPRLETALIATECAARLAPEELAGFDSAGHRERINELLLATSSHLRGPRPGPDLRGADLTGADLRDTDLRDADLRTALFLTEAQLRPARGSTRTRLPAGTNAPREWALAQP